MTACCKLPVALKDKENHDCVTLNRRLAATQQQLHTIDIFTGRLVFKYPPREDYCTLGEYISSIEHRSLQNSIHQALPRRPVPTVLNAATNGILNYVTLKTLYILVCFLYIIIYNTCIFHRVSSCGSNEITCYDDKRARMGWRFIY